MREKELDILIANWITGEITAADRNKMESWLAKNPAERKALEKTQILWEQSAQIKEEFAVDTNLAWAAIEPKLKSGKIISFYQNRAIWTMAASFLILLGLGWLFSNNYQYNSKEEIAFSTNWTAPKAPVAKMLEDGTLVTLNKGAKLSMPNKFGKKTRHVKLEGEASFDVKRMPEKPFIIDAGNFAFVQVLGTSFNVKANANGSVEVKVREGKVKLYTFDNKEVILTANQIGFFDPAAKRLSKGTNNDVNYDIWRTKRLVFTNTQLTKVVEVLNGYYDTNIRVDSKILQNMRLTATFANEPLDQVLELIKESLEIDVVKEGQSFTIIEKKDIQYMFD